MFLRNKFEFLRGPEDETGSAPTDDQVIDQGGETGGETEPQTLRQQLEKNFEAERQTTAKTEEGQKRGSKKTGYTSRARQEGAEIGEVPEQVEAQEAAPAVEAPSSLSKEAKAEWANTPPAIQAAFLKREEDTARGVTELKKKYEDIDKAIAPHMEALRRQGRSPAEAVNQLFGWFQALASNPRVAFPALANSFGLDIRQFVPQEQQQQVEQQQAPGDQPPGDVSPGVQAYINRLEQQQRAMWDAWQQQLGGVQQTFAQQSQAKTQEILDNWSRDKDYFADVREMMAQMIQSGAVPLKNGQVDLDAAYDRAMWAHPDVRAKVIAAQEAKRQSDAKAKVDAERKAQADQADKARRAAVGVQGGAPGAAGTSAKPKGGKGKSVRESIMEARELLSS